MQFEGNHIMAHNRANEAEIPVAASGHKFSIIARVYNDFVAIRYAIPANSKRIDGEQTAIALHQHGQCSGLCTPQQGRYLVDRRSEWSR
ncbi:glycosyl hydrolase family 97 [Mucilaginibacter gracilis]|uniref:Glycosyl hydrolase family 97 n=2 Tax=Mucilaginibacter gracilis TaxID=423350 RepID=A0A495J7D0_9SPHI|nr:glycosyl hydrolase family 97 [Mucilaginibacter gracilis]